MSESNGSAFSSYRALLFRWTRAHTLGAAFALLALFIVLAIQITALSGWHFARADEAIPLAPTSPTVTAVNPAPGSSESLIQYNFVGAPAVAATRTVNVDTSQVLGVRLSFDQIPANVRLSLGWIGTRDRGKPTQLLLRLPESASAKTIYVPLRGYSEWRDSTTQLAVALAARPGTPSITLQRAQFVSATPSGALWHAWGRWTERSTDVLPDAIGERVVPLAGWLTLAALLAFAATAALTRMNAARRRDALLGAATVIAGAIVASHIAVTGTPSGNLSLSVLAWALFLLISLGLVIENMFFEKNRILFLALTEWACVALAIAAVIMGGVKFVWMPVVVIVVLLARRFPVLTTKWRAAIFAVPLIAVLAIAQAWVAATINFSSYALVDPTTSLMSSIWRVGGLAASITTLLLLYAFWPNTPAAAPSRRSDIALALWLSIISIACWFAVMPTNVLVSATLPSVAAFALWAGLAILCAGWLAPTALQPVSESRVEVVTQRTEFDLSSAARQLFDAAAASADAAFAANRSGAALAPLLRMKELAPTSLRTYATEVRYGLVSGRASEAATAYDALKSQPQELLDDGAIESIAAYAEHANDFDTLLNVAPRLPTSEATARRIARAELLRASDPDDGVARALEILQQLAEPNALAHEIAELHLLRDDWQAAQKALVKSAFTPQSIVGSIYVARLGLRATNGSNQYVEQLQKLTTWHNTVGVAQLGMGEILLRQNNANGARARFIVARKTDPTLWPIERRIRDIERNESSANELSSPSDVAQDGARLLASQPA